MSNVIKKIANGTYNLINGFKNYYFISNVEVQEEGVYIQFSKKNKFMYEAIIDDCDVQVIQKYPKELGILLSNKSFVEMVEDYNYYLIKGNWR